MKLYISPLDSVEGGIRRVIRAMRQYLPEFGIQVVDTIEEADIINNHAGFISMKPGVPVIASCHGLLWSDYKWREWADDVNKGVIECLRQSDATTAPSRWVRDAMVRGMALNPRVIYHGVDVPATRNEDHQPYVLWNKTRIDPVCDPTIVTRMAAFLPHRAFATTFAEGLQPDNVAVLGKLEHEDSLKLTSRAGLYLCTVQETFGIGTIEALAFGVPVVGYAWGGQAEIVINGETGYLVPPGDEEALSYAIEQAFKEWPRLSANAYEDARNRWGWRDKIEQYAALFHETYERYYDPQPKVSVIIPYYNAGQYIKQTVQSVLDQTMQDFEIIIYNDGSTAENTKIVTEVATIDSRIHLTTAKKNVGASIARNRAVAESSGRYLMMLDSDDMLAKDALAILSQALDEDRGLSIVYGHLDVLTEDGRVIHRNSWPPSVFEWEKQLDRQNQLPYSVMMRRNVIELTGGYRRRYTLGEDAELWTRATSYGFRAKKVTNKSLLLYRTRNDSVSHISGKEPDWTAWYSWRKNLAVPPFGAQSMPTTGMWPIYAHEQPKVSVIIPVGPGHEKYVIDALDSVFGQSYQQWECIVINDTGTSWMGADCLNSPVCGAPWARVYETSGAIGVAGARNLGISVARAPMLAFLDADDTYMPTFLEKTLRAQSKTGGIVYTDWLRTDADKGIVPLQAADFVLDGILNQMYHTITTIIPKEAMDQIGGFDTTLKGWEDWDAFIALRAAGWCSERVKEPLFIYRFTSGKRRNESMTQKPSLLAQLRSKWAKLYSREVDLMGCSCTQRSSVGAIDMPLVNGKAPRDQQLFALVKFLGAEEATQTILGKKTGNIYRFSATPERQTQEIDRRDIATFEESRLFTVLS